MLTSKQAVMWHYIFDLSSLKCNFGSLNANVNTVITEAEVTSQGGINQLIKSLKRTQFVESIL